MSIILKRPMFRQGGSSAYGVGITSNLEPRKKYQEGTNPSLEDQMKIIKALGQQFGPQPGDTMKNLAFGFGASGADVPAGGLQTWGQAIGKATQMARGLQSQKEATQAAFETQGMLKLLGNVDKTTLTALVKNAQELARNDFKRFPGANDKEKYNNAYAYYLKQLANAERRQETTQTTISREGTAMRQDDSLGPWVKNPIFNNRAASTMIKIRKGELKLPEGVQNPVGFINVGLKGEGDIIVEGDKAIANTKKQGYNKNIFEKSYTPNSTYIYPVTGEVFIYQGNGLFKKVPLTVASPG